MKLRLRRIFVAGLLTIAFTAMPWAQSNKSSNQEPQGKIVRVGPVSESVSPSSQKGDYIIGDDDVLDIDVWNEKALTQKVPVRSDGKITMPLIGDVHAAGLTPEQLQTSITGRLKAYLTDPRVTVIVQEMNSRKFNVLGRVIKPGSYPLTATTTVLDGIAVAGGFQDFAKQKGIYVLREQEGGRQKRIPFNYKSVIKGIHTEQNILLEPQDTIVVP